MEVNGEGSKYAGKVGSGGTTVFYDDRGYVTSLGEEIGDLNGLLCGDTPPTPPTPPEGLAGVDSDAVDGAGRYYRFWPGNGNTNDDCDDDSAFGDTKGLDLWVFEGTTALTNTLSIFAAPDFTDVGTSIAVPLLAFPVDGGAGGGLRRAPPGLTATNLAGPGWTCTLIALSCIRNTVLTVGNSYPDITLTVDVAPDAPASMTNVATVSGRGGEPDANTGDNTDTDIVTVNQVPDLTIEKTHSGPFMPSQSGSYDIEVTNIGTGPTVGVVTVTDTLPADVTATMISGMGWTCMPLPLLSCSRMDSLAAGASYPLITIDVDVSPTAAGVGLNTVNVTLPGELNTTNNDDLDIVFFTPVPDLTIAKSHTGDFKRGQTGAQFSVVVTNVGIVATSGPVTVADTLPSGLTATAIAGMGWTCTLAPLQCTRMDALAASASYPPITLTVDVSLTASSPLVNQTTVSGGGDSNPANNTAMDPVTVLPAPDLALTKSSAGTFMRGGSGSFSVVVENVGPVESSGIVAVADTLPTGLTATAAAGPGWACVIAPSKTQVGCVRAGALAPGASFPPIDIQVAVANNAPLGALTNTATVSGGGDTNPANNTDSATVGVTAAPDLTITKSHEGEFSPGQIGASYTIVVRNTSAVVHSGMVIVGDIVPSSLTATGLSGSGWSCSLPTLRCSRADNLAAGASYPPITVTVNVPPNFSGTVTNYAAVFGAAETNFLNNVARDPASISNPAPAPTLSPIGLAAALLLLLTVAGVAMRRR